MLKALKAKQTIINACIFSGDNMIASYINDAKYDILQENNIAINKICPIGFDQSSFVKEKKFISLFYNIVSDDNEIGTLFIRSDLSDIYKRLKLHILIAASAFIFSLIISLLFSTLCRSKYH